MDFQLSFVHQMKCNVMLCGNIKENYQIDKQNICISFHIYRNLYPLSLYLFGWCNTQACSLVCWYFSMYFLLFVFIFVISMLLREFFFSSHACWLYASTNASASMYNNILLYMCLHMCLHLLHHSAHFALALGSLLYPVYFASISQSPYLFNVTAVGSKCCFHISFFWNLTQTRSDTHPHTFYTHYHVVLHAYCIIYTHTYGLHSTHI